MGETARRSLEVLKSLEEIDTSEFDSFLSASMYSSQTDRLSDLLSFSLPTSSFYFLRASTLQPREGERASLPGCSFFSPLLPLFLLHANPPHTPPCCCWPSFLPERGSRRDCRGEEEENGERGEEERRKKEREEEEEESKRERETREEAEEGERRRGCGDERLQGGKRERAIDRDGKVERILNSMLQSSCFRQPKAREEEKKEKEKETSRSHALSSSVSAQDRKDERYSKRLFEDPATAPFMSSFSSSSSERHVRTFPPRKDTPPLSSTAMPREL